MPQRIRDAFGIVLGVIQITALHYLALVGVGGGGRKGKINCQPVVV